MMAENSVIDARDQRDGGWSWVQNDIYTVFLPIIGREATHLYQVMTYLIPERIRNPIFNLTIRNISEVAGMSKSTVHRELKVLHRVGLMPQVATDPPVFVLADLRKLAKLGSAELKRRLVPQGDNDNAGLPTAPPQDAGINGAQSDAGGEDADAGGEATHRMRSASPAASGGGLVPQGDKEENLGKTAISELTLSQKQGGFVPEKGGSCPTGGTPLNRVSRESEYKNPTLPSRGEGGEKSLFPDETKNPRPDETGPQAQGLWTAFIAELKNEFYSVPMGVERSKRWKPIREGLNDFTACFSGWWLLDVHEQDDGTHFVTYADDEATTEAGIRKYSKRLAQLVSKFFGLAKGTGVVFEVRRSAQRIAPPTNGETSNGETRRNGESHGSDGDLPQAALWEKAKREVKEAAAKAAARDPRSDVDWCPPAVEAARLEAVEAGARKPIWKLRSPVPEKTRAAVLLFSPVIEKAVGDVKIVVLGPEGESK